MSHRAEMLGIKYGRLTPIEVVGIKKVHLLYRCICECGNEIEVLGNSLRSGNTKSCGCIRRPNLIGYENSHGIVIAKVKNQIWELSCKHCNSTHTQNQREIWRDSHSLSCEKYRPPNWSGLEKEDARLQRNYGITQDKLNELIDFQGGKCGICMKAITNTRSTLNVDHDHNTGIVRGILCSSCNTGLGHLGDSIEGIKRALYYLENTPFSEFTNALAR